MKRVRSADTWLTGAGLLFGASSLTYPLGRDQGLFYYVGHEWLKRGALPYKDLFEQKPPFIYALHALLVATTGENAWAIRVAELLATLGIGWLASGLVSASGQRRPGAFGAATFAASVFYYGYLSFGQLANCEIWMTLLAAGALAALRSAIVVTRARSSRRAPSTPSPSSRSFRASPTRRSSPSRSTPERRHGEAASRGSASSRSASRFPSA
jgi:hypothetical protein